MCSFELLMMDGKPRLKHVERLTEINKLRNVASCWLYCANISVTHGPVNVTFKVSKSLALRPDRLVPPVFIREVVDTTAVLEQVEKKRFSRWRGSNTSSSVAHSVA